MIGVNEYQVRQAAGELFSPKPKEAITHSAVGREVKNVAKIAKHGAKFLGRKVKRAHQVGQARRAVKKRMAVQGLRSMNNSFEPLSDILQELVSKIRKSIHRRQAGRSVMRKLTTAKLQKMDKQRAVIKGERKVLKSIKKGTHTGALL